MRGGSRPNDTHGFLREGTQRRDLFPERRPFGAGRQCAPPQQLGGLLEAHAARQLAQLVAANDELTRLAIDVAQTGLAGDDAVQTARFYRLVDESSFTS